MSIFEKILTLENATNITNQGVNQNEAKPELALHGIASIFSQDLTISRSDKKSNFFYRIFDRKSSEPGFRAISTSQQDAAI